MFTVLFIALLFILLVIVLGIIYDDLAGAFIGSGFCIVLFVVIALIVTAGRALDEKYTKSVKREVHVDLPEEIPVVDTSDCLRGQWRNDTLFIDFKNKH